MYICIVGFYAYKSITSNSFSKNHFINSVIVVSFVVFVPALNVTSIDYDENHDDYAEYDNNKVSEARVGTMGTVSLVAAKMSGECSKGGGGLPSIDRPMTKTSMKTTTIDMVAATSRRPIWGRRPALNAAAGYGFTSRPSSTSSLSVMAEENGGRTSRDD